jgi:hypothetical protein
MDTIRLKLLRICARVKASVRRIVVELSSAYPWKEVYAQAYRALLC